MRYLSRCAANRWVFNADRKLSMLSVGSRRVSGNEFQTIGAAAENDRRPKLLRRDGVVALADADRPVDRRRWLHGNVFLWSSSVADRSSVVFRRRSTRRRHRAAYRGRGRGRKRVAGRPVATFRHEEAVASSFLVV